ncbi:hypothetical protein ACQCWA_22885 [Rossellomorea aquimaris]|uniref:hypothetical protein n=1 Tax=Rossellomorea aquimaris TaxID=189382 RepID=UPI003CF7B0E8
MKKLLVLFSALSLILTTRILVNAEASDPEKVKPFAEDWYVTPEDIIRDIVFPSIDKRVMQEYPGNDAATLAGSHKGLLVLFITTIIHMVFP